MVGDDSADVREGSPSMRRRRSRSPAGSNAPCQQLAVQELDDRVEMAPHPAFGRSASPSRIASAMREWARWTCPAVSSSDGARPL